MAIISSTPHPSLSLLLVEGRAIILFLQYQTLGKRTKILWILLQHQGHTLPVLQCLLDHLLWKNILRPFNCEQKNQKLRLLFYCLLGLESTLPSKIIFQQVVSSQ